MAYVYVLSDYEEGGAENVIATLSREGVLGLIDRNWPAADGGWRAEAKGSLQSLLMRSDAELAADRGGHPLHRDWGGLVLHVVELV